MFVKLQIFHQRDVSKIPNSEQKLVKLPYHRPKCCQITNTVKLYPPMLVGFIDYNDYDQDKLPFSNLLM